MRRLAGEPVSREDVEREVAEEMAQIFGRETHDIRPHDLLELLADAEGRGPEDSKGLGQAQEHGREQGRGQVHATRSRGGVPAVLRPATGNDNPRADQGDGGRRGTECRV